MEYPNDKDTGQIDFNTILENAAAKKAEDIPQIETFPDYIPKLETEDSVNETETTVNETVDVESYETNTAAVVMQTFGPAEQTADTTSNKDTTNHVKAMFGPKNDKTEQTAQSMSQMLDELDELELLSLIKISVMKYEEKVNPIKDSRWTQNIPAIMHFIADRTGEILHKEYIDYLANTPIK